MSTGWHRHFTAALVTAALHVCLGFLLISELQVGSISRHSAGSEDESSAPPIAIVELPSLSQSRAATAADFPLPNVHLDARSAVADVAAPELGITEADEDVARPMNAQAAPSGLVPFHCEVHIHQSAKGAVEAVDFGNCNGDAVRQQSLIRSLQRAVELASPVEGETFPAVRTFNFDTSSVSPSEIAQQLSTPEVIVPNEDLRTRASFP